MEIQVHIYLKPFLTGEGSRVWSELRGIAFCYPFVNRKLSQLQKFHVCACVWKFREKKNIEICNGFTSPKPATEKP